MFNTYKYPNLILLLFVLIDYKTKHLNIFTTKELI